MEEDLSINIKRYYNVMKRYRSGEFGKEALTLAQILELANENQLFDEMSVTEIEYLINNSTGITKMLFSNLKNKKLNKKLGGN